MFKFEIGSWSKKFRIQNFFKLRKLFKFKICSNFKTVQIRILFKFEICSKFENVQIKKLFKFENYSNSKIVQILEKENRNKKEKRRKTREETPTGPAQHDVPVGGANDSSALKRRLGAPQTTHSSLRLDTSQLGLGSVRASI
jgi:hypothetical protein